jgi:CheY-like chemotaxis protein
MQSQASRKRIELRRDLAPGLPHQVRGDATRMRQILLNLLSNAVKFTPVEGRVELRAAAAPSASADGRTLLRIEVEDTGAGIPKDRLTELFREFEQGGPSLEPGTGLGLAISARLVEAMGGRIACDSEPGRGTVFRVEIPLETVDATDATCASTMPAQASLARLERPLHVLVVDDVAANRALARTMLTAAGHAVELAENGETAVAAVASGDFDVVLMDVEMPGIGGLEATRRIRALPPPRGRVPIIALTAAALPDQVEACREAGMDGHLAKPIRRGELLRRLAEVARRETGEKTKPSFSVGSDVVALMRQALLELEQELGEGVVSLLSNVAGEFRLGREALAQAAQDSDPSPSWRETLQRLSAGGRMIGADTLAAASDRLFAAIDAGQGWQEALAETRAALDVALAGLDAWFAARASASRSG